MWISLGCMHLYSAYHSQFIIIQCYLLLVQLRPSSKPYISFLYLFLTSILISPYIHSSHFNTGCSMRFYFSHILITKWLLIDLRILPTFQNKDNRSCVAASFPVYSHSKFFTLDLLITLNCSYSLK